MVNGHTYMLFSPRFFENEYSFKKNLNCFWIIEIGFPPYFSIRFYYSFNFKNWHETKMMFYIHNNILNAMAALGWNSWWCIFIKHYIIIYTYYVRIYYINQ